MLKSGAATDVLFDSVQLGPLTLRNRLVLAPMGTCLDADGYITEETIAYYVRRARGGVGTITVEGCLVSPEIVGPEPKIYDPRYLPGLTRLVDALRPYEVTVGVQLMHSGRQVVDGPSVAPSPIPLNAYSPVPHQLTPVEIMKIVADYAQAASFAQQAGFDFVEVHGAHGYLPSNFLSRTANQRTDAYGGDLVGRARFSREVACAIVASVGAEMPLVWRINGDDGEGDSFVVDEAVQVSGWLVEDGVQALSVTSGTWRTLALTLAPMSQPRGQMVSLARKVREAVAVPVMAVGRLDDPELAAEVISEERADLIIIGRGLIAEPDWPRKVQEGRFTELRPCIACNACVDRVGRGLIAKCSVNPEVGREQTWAVQPAQAPRRVVVVGSGLAGLEASLIARLRGHEVHLFERDEILGGKLEAAGLAPSKHEVLRFRDYEVRQVVESGVQVHTSTIADADSIAALKPDAVVIATGADPLLPPIPGLEAPHVYDAVDLLSGTVTVEPGTKVVVIGGSATGCETAETLADHGAQVAIVEMRSSVGAGIEAITRRGLIRDLRRRGVEILADAKVVAVESDHIIYENRQGNRDTVPAAVVCMALGWRPRASGLKAQLQELGIAITTIGDADRPGDFVAAINAGADAGLAL
jgi:2,4-dienoyl-CoA reductase (NADPH2)